MALNPQGYPRAMAEFSVKSFDLFVVKGVRSLLKDLFSNVENEPSRGQSAPNFTCQ